MKISEPGLFINSFRFHEQSVLRTSTAAFSGLRSGLALSWVRSTLSKPATKIFLCLQVLIHEFKEFVNYAGELIISRKLLYFTPDGSGSSAPLIARPPSASPQAIAGRASRCLFRSFCSTKTTQTLQELFGWGGEEAAPLILQFTQYIE